MALSQRISALEKRHEWLEHILAQEMNHLHPDDSRVAQIKKSKLRVKDEMTALKGVEEGLYGVAEENYRRVAAH